MGTKPLALLLLLTVIAGYADAIVFVGLRNIFVANMTGNVVLLGVGLVGLIHHLPGKVDAGMPALALAAFACGVVAVFAFVRKGQRERALVLVGEAVLIAAAAALWSYPAAAIALLSLAMGAQSAAANEIGMAGISTTYVTGTLVTGILRVLQPRPGTDHLDARRDFSALGCYLAGAALGAGAFVLWQGDALWPAPLALAVLGALAYS